MSFSGFTIPADQRVNMKENDNINKYFHFVRDHLSNMWVTMVSLVIYTLEIVPEVVEKNLEEVDHQSKNQDHPDYSIVKISQNTEKCSD